MLNPSCTFFGDSDTPKNMMMLLSRAISNLIILEKVDMFYVGNQGAFDSMVQKTLKGVTDCFSPDVVYGIILANGGKEELSNLDEKDFRHALLPAELDGLSPEEAIERRNLIMIDWSNIVVTYVSNPTGYAAKYKEIAEKAGKKIIDVLDFK